MTDLITTISSFEYRALVERAERADILAASIAEDFRFAARHELTPPSEATKRLLERYRPTEYGGAFHKELAELAEQAEKARRDSINSLLAFQRQNKGKDNAETDTADTDTGKEETT